MVMADKNNEESRNGRRSRGASPHSDDSSDESDQDNGMRVGQEYQAEIPEYCPDSKYYSSDDDDSKMKGDDDGRRKDPSLPRKPWLVWTPSTTISEAKVDEYTIIAKEKHGYNTEQALGLLYFHKHNVEKALKDLGNFLPLPDDWTVEDKVLFEQAFSFHGKSFHRIRQMLPDKSIASLVKYYYSWKKTRSRTSVMDKHARKHAHPRDDDSDGGSEDGSENSDSEHEAKENGKDDKKSCCNCGLTTAHIHVTPKGSMCNGCNLYWRRHGAMKPANLRRHESQSHNRHTPIKHKRRPPRGMYLNQEDIMAMVSGPPGQPESLLKSLDAELVSLKQQVQKNKQMISLQKQKTACGIDNVRPPEGNTRINARWTTEELLLAVQGVRRYGKDFKAIAEVIGNKTEAHLRSFFVNFRRRYNLDEVLAEYEAEHGTDDVKEEEEEEEKETIKMEVDKSPENNNTASHPPPLAQNNGITAVPPPLLKQPPARTNTNTSRLMPQKPTLQQPPPLIRPNPSVPVTVKD
ncbi:REST corepressor 1 [Patella vulgata]|uniref:REST corepressor 1 n=1 Tax=Patella vulgata TaxID=6465 RepID=UPI00217F7C4C|nr:REST corepressor 1 [Patella vulgata]